MTATTAICVPCRNDHHDRCDSTAWCDETNFPSPCDCWATSHARCERCGHEGPSVTAERACSVAHCDGECLTNCAACVDDMKEQGEP